MRQGAEHALEKPTRMVMLCFASLTLLLAAAVPFSVQHARANDPLTQALLRLLF